MRIHPAADLFPMMTPDELQELADDIKQNGLIHPIVLDGTGEVLIDGRNRLKACELAGVEPQFTCLNGQDERAFIVSVNLARRNLKKGQQAMALAMIYPKPERGRGKKDVETMGFSKSRLDYARQVFAHSPALAREVLDDHIALDAALTKIKSEQATASSTEARMERLRAAAPDVADLVVDDRLSLAAAEAEIAERERKIRETIDAGKRAANDVKAFIGHVASIASATNLTEDDFLNGIDFDQIIDAATTLKRLGKKR